MKLIIHRGAKEIGGSCVEFLTNRARIIVDIGMPLVSPQDKKKKLDTKGLDKKSAKELWDMGILPQVPGIYKDIDGSAPSVDAVLISHPHQDHYGLVQHIDGLSKAIDNDVKVILVGNSDEAYNLPDEIKPINISDLDGPQHYYIIFVKKENGWIKIGSGRPCAIEAINSMHIDELKEARVVVWPWAAQDTGGVRYGS